MHLQGVADEIMCRAFLAILKGPARVQQVDAKLHQYLQGVERLVCLTLYRGAQV